MYTPVRMEHWDVVNAIEDYLNEADRSKCIYRKVDSTTITTGQRNWKEIVVALVYSTCDYLSKKRSCFSLLYTPEANLDLPLGTSVERENSSNQDGSKAEGRDAKKCLFYARPPLVDYVVRCNGKVVAAFELKNGGLECPVPMYILWARCSYRTEIDLNYWCNSEFSEGQARNILNCILQLYEYMEIPASDLHLDNDAISSGGWSGYVVGGILNGRRVAVKLAPRDFERAEALLNKISAYEKLWNYWGEFVPSLVGYGITVIGQIIFIATEFIDGSPLGSGTVTEEVADAARQTLGAVHACKLFHGDVEARNIMVVQGTQPSVRLIDFGFAQRSSNWRSQLAELKKLDSVLEDTMRVLVGKESGSRFPAH